MPRSTTRTNSPAPVSSGAAFEGDANLATLIGYATMGSGALLGVAVGAAVAPTPVLGLTSLGAGVAVLGSANKIRSHFAGDTPELPQGEPQASA